MFLEKLKINGFKSFAKPLVIDFKSSLTAIVGPNGSGKSNIVDAIRWSLGEQSAKTLRGSTMSDIIFAGSDVHKPLAKASVTLYFDNREAIIPLNRKKIIVKREVMQDGQSTYCLNGKNCRLKDIQELLMDTGLGQDSYSIIGQGKIDSILNSKAEKLRELFEETAGITKHKYRKNEAEKRLIKTEQSLQRVKDLVWELKKQYKPLKRAAAKANKFKRLQAEYSLLEVNLLLDRWEKNKDKLVELRKEKRSLDDNFQQAETLLEQLMTELESKQKNVKSIQGNLEDLQENYYKIKNKKKEAENNLKILKERCQSYKREKKDIAEQLEKLNEQQVKFADNQKQIKLEIKELENRLKDLEKKLNEKTKQYQQKKEELEQGKEKLAFLRDYILNDNVELKELNTKLDQSRERSNYLELEIEKLIKKREEIVNKRDENLVKQENLKQEIVIKEEEILEIDNNTQLAIEQDEKLKEEFSLLQKKQEKLKDKINKKRSHLKVLNDLEKDYNGYYFGVKNILKIKDKIPKLIGVVAEQLDVVPNYERAIEIALGNQIQNIIVEDEKTAKRCIEYLNAKKAGRATFLAISLVQGKTLTLSNLDIKTNQAYLGLAVEFVKHSPQIKDIVNYLLGKTIIVKDLDGAVHIAKKLKSRYKLVTLNGEVINPSGAITGGSVSKNDQGFLMRSRQMKDLKQRLVKLDNELKDTLNSEDSFKKELQDIKIKKQELQKQNQKLAFKKNDLNKDLLNLRKEQLRLEEELEKLEEEFVEYHNQLGTNDAQQQDLQAKIELINKDYQTEKKEIEKKELNLKKVEEELDKINQNIMELKITVTKIKQEQSNKVEKESNLASQLLDNQSLIEEKEERYEKVLEELGAIKAREQQLLVLEKKLTNDANKIKELLIGNNKLLEKEEKVLEALQERNKHRQKIYNSLKDEVHKNELKLNRLQDRNEQLELKLQEEYEFKPEEGIEERIEITNIKKTEEKIKELKGAIKKLGLVNQEASEEFAQLDSRLSNLEKQKDDLLEAQAGITKLIEDMEKSMTKLFYKTFSEVKDKFAITFKELFAGGKAELCLTNPENLLTTGVEIIAQPPGKQLKKLSLMSGGERALTAIALVFAFLKVNPSPFYILDEIDAPLDDANVTRFANYIKNYSCFTQFVLITHRKRMMTEADTIYGITMEESGISKLVSLKLKQAK